MNSKEIIVNLMIEKICKHIDAGDVHRIVVHGKEFVEMKKGNWIGKPLAGKGRVRCSNCKHDFFGNDGLWNFCPHCEADMRGDKE